MSETPLRCPACGAELRKLGDAEHAARLCAGCKGALVPLRTLTKLLQGPHVQKIASVTPETSPKGRLPCPGCRRWMLVSSFLNRVGSYELDICRECDVVWFDAGEIEAAPTTPEVIDQSTRVRQYLDAYWDGMVNEPEWLDGPRTARDPVSALLRELLWGASDFDYRHRYHRDHGLLGTGAGILVLLIELSLTTYDDRKRKSPLE